MSFSRLIALFCPPLIVIIIKKVLSLKVQMKPGRVNINKESNKGELIILGNSPSLKFLDTSFLVNKNIFVCNDFFRHPEFSRLLERNQVTYFAMDSFNSWQKSFTNREELEKRLYNYHRQIFSTEYTTVIQQDLFDYFSKRKLFVNCRIQPLNLKEISTFLKFQLKEKNINLEIALNVRHTPQAMIIQGILGRFENIKLFGLQHSYVRDRFNQISQVNHFYEEQPENIQQMAHRDLTELFLDSHTTFKVYKELNLVAQFFNIEIIDCTVDGCLDMFKKSELISN
jgi:hypothetical protein